MPRPPVQRGVHVVSDSTEANNLSLLRTRGTLMTDQDLVEADACFQHVCDMIRLDEIPPRQVLFGSTLRLWLLGRVRGGPRMQIVITGHPPNSSYLRATLGGNLATSSEQQST